MSLSKHQLIKNSAWTFFELALYPLLIIIATPVFIKKLGIEQYGLWMLITNITLGINALNIGVGDSNIRLISGFRAHNDLPAIKRVFHYNFSFALFLCLCAGAAGLIFYFSNFISIFYKSANDHLANMLLLLASFSTGIKFIEIGLLSVFKAFERFDIYSKLMLLSRNSVVLLNLSLVLMNYNLATVFATTVIINGLNVGVQLAMLYNFKREILSFPSIIFLKEKLAGLNYNFWYWLQSVIGLLGYLADKLVVAYFTDVKTLGYYSIASLIGTQIHNVFMAFGSFIFPRVSFRLSANSDITAIYYVARSFVALPSWLMIIFLLLSGDVVFKLWLGEDTYLHSIFFIKLYLVYISALLLNIIPFYFINGTAHIRLNSLFEIVLRGSHLLCMVLGYSFYGINGILYGLIFSTLVNLPFQYFYFHKKIIPDAAPFQYLLVILPVVILLALTISENVFFRLSLVLCLIACCKLIYFDSARRYSGSISLLGNFFTKDKSQ